MTFLELLIRLNKGQEDGASKTFADKMGVSQQRVSHWVVGRYVPDESLWNKMAEILGVSVPELLKSFPPKQKKTPDMQLQPISQSAVRNTPELTPFPIKSLQPVPFFGPVCAGGTNFNFNDFEENTLPFYMNVPPGRKIGAWQVHGDCMDDGGPDSIRPGDIIIVAEQNTPETGKIVVAMLDGEITLKKIIHHDGEILLQPKNPKHNPIVVKSESFKVLGVVLWSLRKH